MAENTAVVVDAEIVVPQVVHAREEARRNLSFLLASDDSPRAV